MVIYLKSKGIAYAIDARETAPLSANRNMFNSSKDSLSGGLATAIPGEISGFWMAHRLAGRLPWKKLFEPVIEMCANGFQVSNTLANAIKTNQKAIKENKGLAKIFVNPETNDTYKLNDLIRMPQLARTFKIISEQSPNSFYNGSLTKLMVKEINQNGGNVTLEDFQSYRAILKEPLLVNLNDNFQILTQPLPSSGILVSSILKIMNAFNMTNTPEFDQPLFYHRLVETFKHAFSHRNHFGDDNFLNQTEVQRLMDNLVDDQYLEAIRAKINDTRTFNQSYYGFSSGVNDHGTAHISVLDEDGDAVSLTSSINTYFGAKYAGLKTGIIYNNQMDDFSTPNLVNYYGLKPSEANYIEPGKRPLSSMSPVIIIDEKADVRLVIGASGGTKIITSIAQVVYKNLWVGKNIKESIDDPRIHHQLDPNFIEVEEEFSEEITNYLQNIGHKLKCFSTGGSIVQAVFRNDSIILANSDFRKGGQPDGI